MAKNISVEQWTNLGRYAKENEIMTSLPADANRIVFMGDSITEGWFKHAPDFFADKAFINRGIGGQTTAQMLLRFRSDVINLRPKAVVILGGINDIAGNSGPISLNMIMGNLISMAELSRINNIKVILCSVSPASHFYWSPAIQPAERIISLNHMIQKYAKENHIPFADYHTLLKDSENGIRKEYAPDGVHPNKEGYAIMEPILLEALALLN